jgi:hypothetical protein
MVTTQSQHGAQHGHRYDDRGGDVRAGGGPMDGGAVGRHVRVQRVALARGPPTSRR